MMDVCYLAWRYLLWHRWKTLILVIAIGLVLFLPLGLQRLVDQTVGDMTARADASPLLMGARGSPLELVLSSLYFSREQPPELEYRQLDALRESRLVDPIPLYVRFRSQDAPIVGTTLDYFPFRNLRIASGRQLLYLGEAVLGARAAQALGVGVGDAVISSPESVFDIAGVYPLKMTVVGVLAPNHDQDDEAIFVDIRTAWIIAGLGHGHQDLTLPEAAGSILKADEGRVVANAALVQYNEITSENIDSFHFHGDNSGHPLTAILPVPRDDKARVIFLGRYTSHPGVQVLQPRSVMDQLMATVFAVQRYVLMAMAMVATATGAVVVLVFLLSLRARHGEMLTLSRLGGARPAIRGLMLSEVIFVLCLAGLLAGLLTLLTSIWGGSLMNILVAS